VPDGEPRRPRRQPAGSRPAWRRRAASGRRLAGELPGRLAELGAQQQAELRASQSFLVSELGRGGWLRLGPFRWHDLEVGKAVRATLGVITPLAIGIALGRPDYGSYAALGALPAGFVSFRGITRTRVLAVLLAAVAMTVSTFVGATAAEGAPWVLVAVMLIWGYGVGLTAGLGPAAMTIGLQCALALLIASAIPLDPKQAAVRAGLVLTGGLWQGLLVVSSWALGRGGSERAAMAESFGGLAAYAAQLAAGQAGPPSATAMPGTHALRDPNPLLRNAAREHLLDLAGEAERIRATLTALGSAGGTGQAATAVLAAAEAILTEIQAALSPWPGGRQHHLEQASRLLRELPQAQDPSWQWVTKALAGQLRAAVRITGRLNDAEPQARQRSPQTAGPAQPGDPKPAARPARAVPPARPPLADLMLTLRASLSPDSENGRHALRLAAAAAVAEVVVRATELPHGYWAVLTVFFVLRPDYSSTLTRGLQRAAGTLVGGGLGICTVLLDHVSKVALLGGVAVALLAAYSVYTVSYLLVAVFLTDFVVVQLALLGLPPLPTALARLAGICVGTALALLAYLLWPTWAVRTAAEKFARLFETQGRYVTALLRGYSRPADPSADRLHALQVAARSARLDAQASADRLTDEPDRPPITGELGRELASAGHRLAISGLTIDALLNARRRASMSANRHRDGPADEHLQTDAADLQLQHELDSLADGFALATGQLAAALRALPAEHDDGQPGFTGTAGPDLRELQAAIAAQPGGAPEALLTATDGLVDAVDTATDMIATHLGEGAAGN
jgi:uncharacterized membrane protein YccC